ncbi:MAG: hypothetical protein WA655_00645 [Candidatus Korobacteraceae bacterium]
MILKAVDDGVNEGIFIRERPLFGDFQAFIVAREVDESCGQARNGISQQGVECGAIERVEAALQVDQFRRRIGEPVQKCRPGIRGRLRTTRIGAQVRNGEASLVEGFRANYGRGAAFCQWPEDGLLDEIYDHATALATSELVAALIFGYYLRTCSRVWGCVSKYNKVSAACDSESPGGPWRVHMPSIW